MSRRDRDRAGKFGGLRTRRGRGSRLGIAALDVCLEAGREEVPASFEQDVFHVVTISEGKGNHAVGGAPPSTPRHKTLIDSSM